MSRILVTGATGHLGQAVIAHLLKSTAPGQIVALARDKNKSKDFTDKDIEVRIGDFDDTVSLDKAMQGISKVLLISAMEMRRFQQHKNVVDAARAAGVRHIIYTSVAIRDVNTSVIKPFMESHFQTEDYIKESRLSYTILRNSIYADVIPVFAGENVLEKGIYLPAGDGKTSFITREELAEATAKVLTTDTHENKTYSLTNVETYTWPVIAQVLSEIAGKEIGYHSPGFEDYVNSLMEAGVPANYVQMVSGFALAISKDEFNLVSDDLEQLLGRKPASLSVYLKQVYQ
jgi:NAD(P)H dehydrogenase (quinone)